MVDATIENAVHRRDVLKTAAIGGAVGITGLAGCLGADDDEFPYDGAEIELWIPFGAGGGYDTVVRGVETYVRRHFSEIYDVSVDTVPVNVSGGGGVRMPNELWEEEPDGHIIGGQIAPHFIIADIVEDVRYEVDEFEYVMNCEESVNAIVGDPDLGFDTWGDVVDYAESEGQITIATGGAGATSHLVPESLARTSGIDDLTEYVHFETVAEAPPAIERGEAQIAALLEGTAWPWVDDGVVDYVVYLNDRQPPLEAVPDLPLAPDQDIPEWETTAAISRNLKPFALPPGTSEDIVEVWEEVLMAAFSDPDYLDWAAEHARPIVQDDRETAIDLVNNMHDSFSDMSELLIELRT